MLPYDVRGLFDRSSFSRSAKFSDFPDTQVSFARKLSRRRGHAHFQVNGNSAMKLHHAIAMLHVRRASLNVIRVNFFHAASWWETGQILFVFLSHSFRPAALK